ncbi:E3 ubiquitin/ISG15 ligase TRIM25-like [Cheilinus undulatus]|uniref:E3 ubiquitin/ISG15 ligase TRIM25-like n=1 Tax=Cheilinus undulatus TaxID=241271 RepID=UPI001BD45966|nr:E3 ubiquitin/ISG15 ligase TRIM25-like [Cheilinus undulatus]
MGDETDTSLEELLKCPVCQDIFSDPRQLPCGHSVCMSCLERMLDHTSEVPFRCPDCRGNFGSLLRIQKSYALSSIAEEFKLIRKRKAQQNKTVYCDLCPEKKTLAKKTCLKCEVSMCSEHAKNHHELPVFTGHVLVSPLSDLLERKCPQHEDKVLKYYCSTSRRYMCNICAFEKKQLNQATEASTVLRRQLTEYMDQRFKSLEEQMKESNELVKILKKEKANPANRPLNSVTVVLLLLWFIVLYYAYNYSVENQALTETLEMQQNRVAELLVGPVTSHHPDSENSGVLRLDLDSASPFLGVSSDLRTAERVKTKLNYPDGAKRFDEAPQILSAHCFSSGTHIWEVEAEGYWDIAVSYQSIQRKSKHNSAFGNNAESWSLTHNGKGNLFVYHNGEKTVLSATLKSQRIAVSVNIEDGNIIFTAVESTIKHLHEFKTNLTEPVCLGLGLYRVDPPSRASIVKVT